MRYSEPGTSLFERGALGLHSLSIESPLPGDAKNARLYSLIASVILALSFGAQSRWHATVTSSLETIALIAAALAYAVCACFLLHRFVIARSPALSVLAGGFLLAASLMIAQALSPAAMENSFVFAWQLALALGIAAYAAIECIWERMQFDAARLGGYYTDDRSRFVRLSARQSNRWIIFALATTVLLTVWTVYVTSHPACCVDTTMWQKAKALVLTSATVVGIGLLMLAGQSTLQRLSRRTMMVAIAVGAAACYSLLPPAGKPASLMGLAGITAVISLMVLPGQATIFRAWLLSSALANCLSIFAVLRVDGTTVGGTGYLYALLAALIPLAVLIYNARSTADSLDVEALRARALAPIDRISGVGSYTSLEMQAAQHIARARSLNETFSAVVVDVKGLKAANIAYGRHVGHELLSFTGFVLSTAFGPHGFVARIKGDEFMVLLPLGQIADRSDARKTLEAIVQRECWRNEIRNYGLYVDVVDYDPVSHLSPEQFLTACKERVTLQKKFSLLVNASPSVVAEAKLAD